MKPDKEDFEWLITTIEQVCVCTEGGAWLRMIINPPVSFDKCRCCGQELCMEHRYAVQETKEVCYGYFCRDCLLLKVLPRLSTEAVYVLALNKQTTCRGFCTTELYCRCDISKDDLMVDIVRHPVNSPTKLRLLLEFKRRFCDA